MRLRLMPEQELAMTRFSTLAIFATASAVALAGCTKEGPSPENIATPDNAAFDNAAGGNSAMAGVPTASTSPLATGDCSAASRSARIPPGW